MQKKILVVDDDPMVRKMMAKALAPMEYNVIYSSDGIHALDILRCNPDFDLLISDVQMPTLDGRQLIMAAQSDKKLSGIPIIIMSGVVGVREVADLLEKGATKFIPKPLNNKIMRDDVASCLEFAEVQNN